MNGHEPGPVGVKRSPYNKSSRRGRGLRRVVEGRVVPKIVAAATAATAAAAAGGAAGKVTAVSRGRGPGSG